MKYFTVTIYPFPSFTYEVEADNEEDAKEEAIVMFANDATSVDLTSTEYDIEVEDD
jgi:hypothetical protein